MSEQPDILGLEPYDLRITGYGRQSGFGAGGMTVCLNPNGITVLHINSGIGVTCDSERSQWSNKQKALRLLSELLRKEGVIK